MGRKRFDETLLAMVFYGDKTERSSISQLDKWLLQNALLYAENQRRHLLYSAVESSANFPASYIICRPDHLSDVGWLLQSHQHCVA